MIGNKGCNFEWSLNDRALTILLKGEIDHHSAVSTRSMIDAKIYELRPINLELDLSGIDFMDSSGLGLIMGRYALMKKIGGDFWVLNPTERILRIFELAGLGKIIEIKNEKGDKENEGNAQN